MMNKIRILGLLLLFTGSTIMYIYDNSGLDFLSGILVGAGLIWTITGQVRLK
ncbi:hypothetical protein [Gillisia limnaea]|uniref:Membrane protein n=1 Tax=Gillisia limnaea (strain DSM 15749 / LMG 21470 / R-8282) TaxID=865937 RepID=H2BQK8_GILLR|nr:hypothetical protein [Gillisia limnaea]EHQ04177.1 membrane protein [Gillisia limnaea DSM 15749]